MYYSNSEPFLVSVGVFCELSLPPIWHEAGPTEEYSRWDKSVHELTTSHLSDDLHHYNDGKTRQLIS